MLFFNPKLILCAQKEKHPRDFCTILKTLLTTLSGIDTGLRLLPLLFLQIVAVCDPRVTERLSY